MEGKRRKNAQVNGCGDEGSTASTADGLSQVSAQQSICLARKRRPRCVFICRLKIGGILFSEGAVQWLELLRDLVTGGCGRMGDTIDKVVDYICEAATAIKVNRDRNNGK